VQRCVPDLAIEIVSRNDTFEQLMKKARRYRKCGTKEVWIFDTEGREAVVLADNRRVILEAKDQFQSDLIPGFSIRLNDLFDDISR
jgi:Uma2 family endonuclease